MIAVLMLALAGAALPPAWTNWKYARTVGDPHTTLTAVVIPASIYANAQPSLNDLRVIDDNGAAVPFTLDVAAGDPSITDGVLTDTGFVRGAYSQAVGDFTARHEPYNAVDLATNVTNFSERVDVDASDDRRTWRTIRSGAPIYDFARDGLAQNMTVRFPSSTARYVRVRVLRRNSEFPIFDIRVSGGNRPSQPLRYPVTVTSVVHDPQRHATIAQLTHIEQVPIDRLTVDSKTPKFSRTVDVQIAQADGTWQTIASPNIRRTGAGDDQRVAVFGETQAGRWQIIIHDGDNAPLAGITAGAYGQPRTLFFDAVRGRHYCVIYGNPLVDKAEYDFAQTHLAALRSASDVALAGPVMNTAFVSPEPQKPWTERNAWVLWIALGIAVLGIGAVAIRTVASPPARDDDPSP